MSLPLAETLRSEAGHQSAEPGETLDGAMEEHWSSVCETLYYLVGDWDEAQDLALETFWRLHKRAPHRLQDFSNLGGWLYRVATNLGLNALRARRRRQAYEEEAAALRLDRAAAVDPEDELERRETREQVRHVLSHMKRRKAQLLMLRHTGHSYAEIAGILSVSPSSMGTLLARAEKDFERRYRALEDVP